MRWILSVQDYDINYTYIEGKKNKAADVLSRDEDDYMEVTKLEEIFVGMVSEPKIHEKLLNIKEIQEKDEKLKDIIEKVHKKIDRSYKKYKIEDGTLYTYNKKGKKLVLPLSYAKELTLETHEMFVHVGFKKIYKMLQENFVFEKMRHNIQTWLRSCEICQKTKYINYMNKNKLEIIQAKKPNEYLSIDFIGPLAKAKYGNLYVLVCIDAFTRFVQLYPLKSATAKNVIEKIFNDYIPKFGKPEKIQSDRGTQFSSKLWLEKCKKENIKAVLCAIRHPQSAIVERYNKEIKRCFRSLVRDKHGSWLQYIDKIQMCLNNVPHEATGFCPSELHLNLKPERNWYKFLKLGDDDLDYHEKLIIAEKNMEKRKKHNYNINKRRKNINYNIGDKVLIEKLRVSDTKKNIFAAFLDIWEGPYIIMKINSKNTYTVGENGKIRGIFHGDYMKKYFEKKD